jgi:hypothetical protein
MENGQKPRDACFFNILYDFIMRGETSNTGIVQENLNIISCL